MTAALRARGRALSIAAHVRAGWMWLEERGLLSRGAILKRPSEPSPLPQPWMPNYNPVEHSVAVMMGAEPVYYGRNAIPDLFRFSYNGLYCDANGRLTSRGNIDGVCIGCGTRRDEKNEIIGGDFRWKVRTEHPSMRAERWQQAWTYCRVCVTPEQLEAHRTWQRAQQQTRR